MLTIIAASQLVSTNLDTNPFAVFSFLVAPAILTNASALLALSTSNRLGIAVQRQRDVAGTILSGPTGTPASPSLTFSTANKQFEHAHRRPRILIRALRFFYLALGTFASATVIGMLGAAVGLAKIELLSYICVGIMLTLGTLGVVSLAAGALSLVAETTSSLEMLKSEELAVRETSNTPNPFT